MIMTFYLVENNEFRIKKSLIINYGIVESKQNINNPWL